MKENKGVEACQGTYMEFDPVRSWVAGVSKARTVTIMSSLSTESLEEISINLSSQSVLSADIDNSDSVFRQPLSRKLLDNYE